MTIAVGLKTRAMSMTLRHVISIFKCWKMQSKFEMLKNTDFDSQVGGGGDHLLLQVSGSVESQG